MGPNSINSVYGPSGEDDPGRGVGRGDSVGGEDLTAGGSDFDSGRDEGEGCREDDLHQATKKQEDLRRLWYQAEEKAHDFSEMLKTQQQQNAERITDVTGQSLSGKGTERCRQGPTHAPQNPIQITKALILNGYYKEFRALGDLGL